MHMNLVKLKNQAFHARKSIIDQLKATLINEPKAFHNTSTKVSKPSDHVNLFNFDNCKVVTQL